MITIKKEGVVLNKTSLVFEEAGVLNPAIMHEGNDIHMFYRAVRKGNYSSIGYCKLDSPLNIIERWDTPLLFPQLSHELQGVEDPRIVKIDGVYYLTYTAYDGINALGSLATSTDLRHFEKHGVLVPKVHFSHFFHLAQSKGNVNEKYFRAHTQDVLLKKLQDNRILLWDKNVIFFPRRINKQLVFLHRIRPGIQIVFVNELPDLTKDFWDDYFLHFQDHILMDSHYEHEASYIGGGCPPIETEDGWLLIYHGVHDTPTGYIYCACASLLDLENPGREIARLPYPLFHPEYDYELTGYVNNVCFPTGTVLIDNTLYIYYGAADEQIACASLNISELIAELKNHPVPFTDKNNQAQ